MKHYVINKNNAFQDKLFHKTDTKSFQTVKKLLEYMKLDQTL